MAKQVLEIKDFSGGLNCSSDARDIQFNQFSQLWNVSPSQAGILKIGGCLVQYIDNLPHNSSNYQEGYGLFAVSFDTTPTIIEGQFENAFEEGTVVACSGTSLTLAALPTFQSVANHNTDNFYRNMTVLIYEGNGIGESRRIVSYDYTDADPDTHIATITDAFSGSVNSSSKYKIFRWAGDNTKFGNQGDLDYIDKGGTTFPYDDIESHDTDYQNSYFLRTKSATISDGASLDLGFITYNPSSSYSWGSSVNLSTGNTSTGNNTLKSGVTYTMSFWCKASNRYYGYVSDADNSANQRGERVPFVHIYSDSVTDGTNTGLYLFESSHGPVFQSGSESTYDYADNLTNEYVKNGDFEDADANGGDGGHGGATDYDPPTDWMAYDGYAHHTNNTITYSYIAGSNAYGAEGNTLNMNPGSDFANLGTSDGHKPNCYLYQDLTLEDNQWYELSFLYSTNNNLPIFTSIVDTNNLTSTGIVSAGTSSANGATLAADDGSGVLTVDGTTATDALALNKEIYTSNGTFLGVCTSVDSGTQITFAAGTAAPIPNDTTLYTANYIKKWNGDSMMGTGSLTTYWQGGRQGIASKRRPYRFFVPENSGTPRVIRIAFAPFNASHEMRLDGVSVKKSLPDINSMSDNAMGSHASNNPYSDDVTSWNQYKFKFKIPSEYNNASDWVINLNAGSYGYQNGAAGTSDTHTVYFDSIKIESPNIGGDLIFLNDNTSSESKINIYSENEGKWIDNTGLTWSGVNMKPVYNYINGMLKISDANFESGNKSKLYFYNKKNNQYNIRSNPLSLPPSFEVSANEDAFELDKSFDAISYNNSYTFKDNHQYYIASDGTKTATNWSTDDADGNGRIIWYYCSENGQTDSNPLYDSGGTEYTDIHYSDVPTNPLYFSWCGTHGGSGDIATNDMHTTISSQTTGSVSKISFQFTYSWQGDYSVESGGDKPLKNMYPPIFNITAGKRSGTDIFGSGTAVTANNQRDLSLGDDEEAGVFVTMDNEPTNPAIIYSDKIGGKVYCGGGEDNPGTGIENDVVEEIKWEDSNNWPWDTVTQLTGHNSHGLKSQKTFYGEINFEDGDIELADDIILKVQLEYPLKNNKNMQDCLDRGYESTAKEFDFPRYEKIKFTNLRTHFRTTNWTPLGDGLPISQTEDLTKANFTFATPSGATAFGWEERIFEIGISSVNIFNEESTIKASNTYIGVTTSGVSETSVSAIDTGESPDISVYLTKAAFQDSYRKKIKYYMKDTKSDIWYLQFYVDTETNTIHSTTSNYKSLGVVSETNGVYQYFIPREKMVNYNEVDSYESQTLISQELTDAQLTCDYKTAVVANNRLYVGNIRQDEEVFPDRMIKSPIGKYNILPKDNFIDVAINDGDEITALEYFKDKLLQFKKRKVFVINVSGDYEFLEDTFDNIGVASQFQVTKTPYGICWANQSGLHIYDGNQTINLIDGFLPNNEKDALINENYWSIVDKDTSTMPRVALVGYNPKEKEIIIKAGIKGKTFGTALTKPDGYVYSFKSKSWYMTHKTFQGLSKNTYNAALSNFTNNSDGELISYVYQISDTHNVNNILKWQTSDGNDENLSTQKGLTGNNKNPKLIYITTSDFTFNNIASRKKIYKVYITYKSTNSSGSSADSEILVKYATNGTGTFNGTFEDSSDNYSASTGLAGSADWATAILKPSSSINNIYSFQLQFTKLNQLSTDFPATGFQINDISIVYREKRVK